MSNAELRKQFIKNQNKTTIKIPTEGEKTKSAITDRESYVYRRRSMKFEQKRYGRVKYRIS